VLNSPEFLEAIRAITGCKQFERFSGRVYRMWSGVQNQFEWHNDLNDDSRRLGFSLNLSADVFRGGAFELRDCWSHRLLAQVANPGFGDAIVFRLSPNLEHRVTDMVGEVPKIACAGWFRQTGATYFDAIRDPNLAVPASGALKFDI